MAAPEGRDVRPTTDKVREAVFGSLGSAVHGANVLDVFGGSGALGLEAASRGAAHVVIIEKSPQAQRIIRQNLAALGRPDRVELICAPYERAMHNLSGLMKFGLFFIDPPYASGQYVPCLETIRADKLAEDDAIFVLESSAVLEDLPDGFEVTKRKKYGTVHIAFGSFR